jgi:slime mold repeat-containing protein
MKRSASVCSFQALCLALTASFGVFAQQQCQLNSDCQGPNLCAIDTCDQTTHLCQSVPKVCNDNNVCTTDSCDANTGNCVFTPISCDDHNACTVDSCNPATGCVHFAKNCDDNNTCTIDTCDPVIGCVNTPVSVDTCQPFEVKYVSNLTAGDSVINISNSGVNGAPLNGPGIGTPAGNLCVNVYAFSPDEQEVSCCSCLVTPNGLVSISALNDLTSNTLTGVRPSSLVVKLVSTLAGGDGTGTSCTNSAATEGPFAVGLLAWGTTVHPAVGGGFATTETPFTPAALSQGEYASITNRCTNIIGNGSTFGICKSCRSGGLGGVHQ